MTLGYLPWEAMEVTYPEYLTYIIGQLPPQEETDDVNDVKARMAKMRADKAAENAR
jgi:hypothetical protein